MKITNNKTNVNSRFETGISIRAGEKIRFRVKTDGILGMGFYVVNADGKFKEDGLFMPVENESIYPFVAAFDGIVGLDVRNDDIPNAFENLEVEVID